MIMIIKMFYPKSIIYFKILKRNIIISNKKLSEMTTFIFYNILYIEKINWRHYE